MIVKDRHLIGEFIANHKDRVTKTPVGTDSYDYFVENINSLFEYDVGYIPPAAAHRPDLISHVFYDTTAYWWLIMLFNNVTDPFEQLNVGDQILIPRV
jgi:hypothetical protein